LGGIGVEDCCGVSVGLGDAVSPAGADSSAVGEPFFRCGDAVDVGVGVGELFFFLGVADCDSSSSTGVDFFFFGEGDADGVGELSSRVDDDFFEGVGVGVGDFCFVDVLAVFFRGLGVGVGVEKIFLRAPPRDWSADLVVSIGKKMTAIKMRIRKSM
jgi:hypothetical protein